MVRDLSHLPVADPAPPTGTRYCDQRPPTVGAELILAWYAEHPQTQRERFDLERPWRASYGSSRCDRQLYYNVVNETDWTPWPIPDYWRVWVGTAIHSILEAAGAKRLDGWEFEAGFLIEDPKGSGHADYLTRDVGDAPRVLMVGDTKTVNGTKFRELFGGKQAEYGHVVQVAAAMEALDADQGVIVYVSLESKAIGRDGLDANDLRRFVCEYTISKAQAKAVMDVERTRWATVEQAMETSNPPARLLHDPECGPVPVTISNPRNGMWRVERDGKVVQGGTTWRCRYCNHQETCLSDGP